MSTCERSVIMKCCEFLTEQSRCKRGIPVARLFRHYFCEGNHARCPLKTIDEEERERALWKLQGLPAIKGGA